jgi:hypothetical protein
MLNDGHPGLCNNMISYYDTIGTKHRVSNNRESLYSNGLCYIWENRNKTINDMLSI